MILTELKPLGVTPKHLARLLGINRVTASNWVNGHSSPHPILHKKASKLLLAAQCASLDHSLPPPKDYRGVERDQYIIKTLAKHIAMQKTRP
jgi:transcriptional regulator with XRE-family HTH domain